MNRIKRIIRDIEDMNVNQSHKEGLYYFYNEQDVTVGYGLILCDKENTHKDNPYSYGAHVIKFEFPQAYPNIPPACTYINYTNLRMSPNFHDNGKVCASRLNTWEDNINVNKWVGTMDIYSVLKLIKISILTVEPLNNEPPYDYSTFKPILATAYSDVVKYANMLALTTMLQQSKMLLPVDIHRDIITVVNKHVSLYRTDITHYLKELHEQYQDTVLNCAFYSNCAVECHYDNILRLIRDKS